MSKRPAKSEGDASQPETSIVPAREGPLVFISHDTRDADLAEAFANLLTDASGGMLKSFRSSDRKGTAGIEFGQEWYKSIMTSLAKATDVVALLTHHSLDRPWILYESGVAKGKLDTTVLGVAVGIPLEKTQLGPFAQFQNCGDDEDSLTKLIMQLIRRNPNAAPRDEAVRLQVRAFRVSMESVLKSRGKVPQPGPNIDDAVIAKMFEEVKILVRDLPERIQGGAPSARRRRLRRVHPGMLDEFMHNSRFRERGIQGISLLIYLSSLREDFPWLYEVGLELYRTLQRGDDKEIDRALDTFKGVIELTEHGPMGFDLLAGSPEDEEALMLLRHLVHDLDRTVHRLLSHRKLIEKLPPSKLTDSSQAST